MAPFHYRVAELLEATVAFRRVVGVAAASIMMTTTFGLIGGTPAGAASSCAFSQDATRDRHYPPGTCKLYVSRSSVPAGQTVAVNGYGYRRGEHVRIALYPGHSVIAATTAYNASGKISVIIRIPRNRTPGSTVIGAYGVTSGRFATVRITVTAP